MLHIVGLRPRTLSLKFRLLPPVFLVVCVEESLFYSRLHDSASWNASCVLEARALQLPFLHDECYFSREIW